MKKKTTPNTGEKASTKDQIAPERAQADNNAPNGEKPSTEPQASADTFIGTYRTSTALNVRKEADADAEIVGVLPVDVIVSCYGGYTITDGVRYLYVKSGDVAGFCQIRYLIKTA